MGTIVMNLSNNGKAEFERDYRKAWELAVKAVQLEEQKQFEEASKNYIMSAAILSKLLEKPMKPELSSKIRNKCFEYRERAELLRNLSEKKRKKEGDAKKDETTIVLHGPEIGLKIIEILRSATSEIMIMSYLVFDVKTIKAENKIHRVNLIDTLIQKSKEGVKIRIITSPPDIQRIGNNASKQGKSVKRIITESDVQVKFCNFAHFKFIVVDGLLTLRGSANLTSIGMAGKGDIAEITDDKYIVNYYSTLFNERWKNIHKSCIGCNERVCTKEIFDFEH
ncbi:MAG: phospholipase D-like domain-containing protein [Candidatus Jordarchaeaceae archaeon]